MSRLVLIIAAALLISVGYYLLKKRAKKQGKIAWVRAALIGFATLMIFLTVTGRVHVIAGVIGALLPLITRALPLIRYWPLINSFMKKMGGSSAQTSSTASAGTSRVSTALLDMTLDIQTGKMDGTIIAGGFLGRKLSGLSLAELKGFYQECLQSDIDTVRLLDAYVKQEYGEQWEGNTENASATQSGPMSSEEARLVLGLEGQPDKGDIIKAHRKLISKLHPDKGGNDYLATKINQARDILLKAL